MEPEPSLPLSSRLSQPSQPPLGPYRTKSKPRANKSSSSGPYARRPQTSSGIKTKEQPKPSLAHRLGLSLLPPTRGEAHTPGTVRPGLKAPFRPSRGTGFDSEEEEEPRRPKKEPQGTPARHLGSLTPFDTGSSVKQPKMDLPDPYKGDTRGRKATQWLDRMMLWIALHRDQQSRRLGLPIIGMIIKGKGNPPNTIRALTAKFKEAFANPNAKRAAARKIAALTQTTTTSEYVTEFQNLMAELDWNTEAYIAQFTRGLHWKVKELLSTKDNIPNNDLEAIFAALVKIDNTRRENEENRPRRKGLSPRVWPLCQVRSEGTWDQTMSNGWKATIKEVAKVAEDESGKE
ncbi:Retrotransposon gag protein [Rhizoctonia solani]|uniref:Retrotransposon gag protein n=1 Tax=Rhizoctonia solani TaxID=456999 RepID=A0A8H7IBT0_9AGAM|nr:Retrotransposon gag protein [Rhizoctonia solani]